MKHTVFIIILSLVILQGCITNSRQCPLINQETLDYLPYQEGDSYLFDSGDGDVRLVCTRTTAVETDRGYFDECGCNSKFQLELNFDTLTIFQSVSIENTTLEGFSFSYVEATSPSSRRWVAFYESFHDQMTIDGSSYNDVIIYKSNEIDQQNENDYFEFTVAKGYGILSIKYGQYTWLLKEPKENRIELSELEIEKEIC